MIKKRSILTALGVLGLMGIGAGVGMFMSRYYTPEGTAPEIEGLLWPGSKQIGEFSMVDHRGDPYNRSGLEGRWSFLFFGYTFCPDVCPVTMSLMDQFYSRLKADGSAVDVQVLFVTVDPRRDSTERLSEYVGYFNEDFVGLGGSLEQVDSLASQIGISYMYGIEDGGGNYLVNHTSSVFLLDPQARLVSIFSSPRNADDLYNRFTNIRKFLQDKQ